jgi:putative CocE/NonD family hydrolase
MSAERGDFREFFGVAVPNPQRWLDDLDSPRVKSWVADQDRRAVEFLSQCAELERCKKFLDANLPVLTQPWSCRRGDRHFYLARREGLDQPVVCVRDDQAGERALIDPNATGKQLVIDQLCVSEQGTHIAFALVKPGEVPSTLHVFDVATGMVTESSITTTVMPVFAWHPNGSGFYYTLMRRLTGDDGSGDPRKDGLYWHGLGGDWREDRCVKEYHDGPGHIAFAQIADGQHLVLSTLHFSSGKSGVSIAHLDEVFPRSERPLRAVRLFDELEGFNHLLGAADGELYFHTTRDAPMGRVVAITPGRPLRSQWRTVVAQGTLALARGERFGGPSRAAMSDEGLLLTYLQDAHSVLVHFALSGKQRGRVELPNLSTVDAIECIDGGFRIFTQSFLEPRVVHEYRDGKLVETDRVGLPDVDPSRYELKQVFYNSYDGTRVPMYLLHAKDLPRSGNHPTLLYGYGGFNQAITPEFHPDAALWLELGGPQGAVFALANIRGGGEYGEAWHAAGSGAQKQNTFDDFYAAGEYLIAQGYTGAHKLCIRGLSNGGLLTAVAAHQRADLFAAVITEIPLVDLFCLDGSTAGQSVTAEYGSPADSREVFEVMRRYSPIQNVKPHGPAQLVVAAEHDFSAHPAQIYRYVAERLDQLESDDQPVLLRLVPGEGHTGWSSENTRRTIAEEIAFLRHFVRADAPGRGPDRRDFAMPMRDGVHLSANIWLPRDFDGPFPVVLLRTPYGNDEKEFSRLGLADYVAAGFAVVYQSVRGRGHSQGQFGFFFVEGKDGHDSVEWLAKQDWCNGKVAMDGGSYLGTAQWLAAREHPPHLTCIMPSVPAGDWFNEIPYVGGALQVDWAFSWLAMMAGIEFDFDQTGDKNLQKYRPLIDAEKVLGAELPHYKEILGHATFDAYWKQLEFNAADFLSITIPVLTVTGWFDGDQAGSMSYWRGIEQHSTLRERAQLVVGPWQHAQCYLGGETKLDEMEFGAGSVLPTRQIRLRFLRRHVLGQELEWEPRVRVFVSGLNKWLASDRYPPAQSQVKPFYLCAEGKLARINAQGGVDRYAYDPNDPVPYKAGAKDHRELEARADVVVYSTEVLREPITVVGPVELVLVAASDQLDTDFTAKLLDVYPDGRAVSLTHVGGVLRARYRNGFEQTELLVRSQPYEFRIRLSHVGHTFLPGHRIRLHVSSSCFPAADPNTNTGGDFRTDVETLTAAQTIFHDPEHQSRLLLPVLEQKAG